MLKKFKDGEHQLHSLELEAQDCTIWNIVRSYKMSVGVCNKVEGCVVVRFDVALGMLALMLGVMVAFDYNNLTGGYNFLV